MKRGARVQNVQQAAAAGPRVEMKSQVLRDIRLHARSSMSAEICGVLIGAVEGEKTVVEASIQGEEARQGGSHVTFTQDTWTHIYKVKDVKYPDKRIVGWYHSHPGFGIFLSEHDTFIHKNFFSDPAQIAWVYDPHSDEEGCFAWEKGEIKRITEMAVRDEPGEAKEHREKELAEEFADEPVDLPEAKPKRGGRRIVRVIVLTLTHLFALILGLAAGWLAAPPIVVVPEPALRRSMESPVTPPDHPVAPEEGGRK
jgi:proteasome lid subunit RPN8/RPN11